MKTAIDVALALVDATKLTETCRSPAVDVFIRVADSRSHLIRSFDFERRDIGLRRHGEAFVIAHCGYRDIRGVRQRITRGACGANE